jgi:hypothetical protein
MKKKRLEQFNKMVEQHRGIAQDLCEMAGVPECDDDFFTPPAKEPTPTPPNAPKENGNAGWLRKVWPF